MEHRIRWENKNFDDMGTLRVMCFFFTAGDKYLRKMEEERFFQNTNYHFTDKQELI